MLFGGITKGSYDLWGRSDVDVGSMSYQSILSF
jgi:hypothetical protein